MILNIGTGAQDANRGGAIQKAAIGAKHIHQKLFLRKIDGEVLRFEDVVYAGGEGMNHTFYVMIRDGKNKSVKLLWESQEVTVSRIKRVRFGEIFLTKDMPKGAWKELDLKSINYLRELVGLPQEKNTLIVPDLKRGKSKVQKIKKAVRRYENKLVKDSSSFKSSTRSKLRHKK